MKKILCLFFFVFLLNGCDDGDITVESFDFSTVETKKCNVDTDNFFVFKINGKEALIVKIPKESFPNEVGTDIVHIGGANQVIYRLYNDELAETDICTAIPSSTPTVKTEWVAIAGDIEIVTNVINPLNETTGATVITGYNHTITFKNIVFDRGDGTEQSNDSITFGTYRTDALQPVAFNNININDCTSNNLLFKFSGVQALTLNLDAATYATLFANETTATGQPRTAAISATNKLNYRVFTTGLTLEYFCAATTPTTPARSELWEGEEGGVIEVETTTNGPNFVHTIRFRNVKYKNPSNQLEFSLGTNYLFGEFVTQG
ncbi:hypothetical protein [Flavobacterium sp. 3HN19-14]|uniref:hypothetical protein n=1 Tax=Flavobacterium sp. 3HN19-14 TaxID=3448133 RepID=UPI003EE053E0